MQQQIYLDDFSPLFEYSSEADFTTPDVASETNAKDYAQYYDYTYHQTSKIGANFRINATANNISIYGAAGPLFGSFHVTLDGVTSNHSAYSTSNQTRALLFSAEGLSDGAHSLSVVNTGASNATEGNFFSVDYALLGFVIQGTYITNTTIEDDSPLLVYSGDWSSNSEPGRFSGGTTHFTNSSGAYVELKFNGSAIYVTGDSKNDHTNYNVTLDGNTTSLNGMAGCGGTFGPTCEKYKSDIEFFAAFLNSSEHTIRITNVPTPAEPFNSYFDLDSFIITGASATTSPGGVPATTGLSQAVSSATRGSTPLISSTAPLLAVLLYGVRHFFRH